MGSPNIEDYICAVTDLIQLENRTKFSNVAQIFHQNKAIMVKIYQFHFSVIFWIVRFQIPKRIRTIVLGPPVCVCVSVLYRKTLGYWTYLTVTFKKDFQSIIILSLQSDFQIVGFKLWHPHPVYSLGNLQLYIWLVYNLKLNKLFY